MENNEIFSWGNGVFGQLGNGTESIFQSIPVKVITSSKHIPSIVYASYYNSFYFDTNNNLFSWGRTQSGSLGKYQIGVNILTPNLFQYKNYLNSEIISFSVNKDHGGLITREGKAYTWGVEYEGRLCQKGTFYKDKLEPIHDHINDNKFNQFDKSNTNLTPLSHVHFREISIPEPFHPISFKQISCGSTFTIFLSNKGEVYSCGSKKEGCLGNSTNIYDLNKSNIDRFNRITFFDNMTIKKIQAGNFFACALNTANELYCWGKNDFGQLGIGNYLGIYKKEVPEKINLEEEIEDFFLGEDHAAVITKNKDTYIWGYGFDGRLCNGQLFNSPQPIKLDSIKNIKKLSLGGQHTAILTHDNNLYMCGNGRNGEIGRGNKIESSAGYYSTPMLIDYFQDKNKKIIDVSCGRNHTLVLTNSYI